MDQQRAWHAMPAERVLAALSTSPRGLDPHEVRLRRAAHGPNQLPRQGREGLLALAWRQLDNPISWVLVVAGLVALGLGKGTDAVVIFGAVFVNAAIGFVQEWRAERAIEALTSLVADEAVVVRGGARVRVPAEDLVPGDVVVLEAGDKVPADLRLLSVHRLSVDESALTGESVPVAKRAGPVEADAVLGDRVCMAFGGTLVTRGAGEGVVVATAGGTELGRISALLERTERLTTPVMQQLAQVCAWIAAGVLATSLTLFAYALLVRDAPLGDALLVALTLAVAAIPEGLPPIITIALAIGVSRMAARRAVIRHLPAVETLGSTTVICSDKTGTLTRNEMTVQALWVSGREYELSGVGYGEAGGLTSAGAAVAGRSPDLDALLACAVLCNDARLAPDGAVTGDPTEAALLVAARKAGLDEGALRSTWERLDVVPFDSEVMFMATVDGSAERRAIHLKGSLEQVLTRCDLAPPARAGARAAMEAFAARGLRVLAFAARSLEAGEVEAELDRARGFAFLGLAGMIDPPRGEAVEAVRACHAAGIVVKMLTGDHPSTATAVGRAVGILGPGEQAVTGAALERLDDAGLEAAVVEGHVFARVAPVHKLRLVQALQRQGHVVAVTGDGVNDAPALKRADIGVAMGITGTAVARESAKVVLTDDNFASIAAAVEEGRRVFDNLVKALAFVLPTNLGIALILVAAMVLFPSVPVRAGDGLVSELLLPMSPTQILWINLVSSVTLSVPIAFENLEPDAMRRRPRRKDKPILSKFLLERTLMVAVLMAAGACGMFLWEYGRMVGAIGSVDNVVTLAAHRQALAEAQTMAVTTVVCFQAFYLLNCRCLRASVLRVGVFTNPWVFVGIAALLLLQAAFVYVPALNALFGSAPLDAVAWLDAALVGAIVVPVVAVEKWIRRRRARRSEGPGVTQVKVDEGAVPSPIRR